MAEKIFRCAVYTRKSTEDGLEQEFNSLDAQYEACAAYALSQRHEGWVLLKERYDDGGFSGGNMERPGLKRLLADVEAGRIDIILLYKIDRLTRSLTDFSRIVDVLDRAKASFVSITQSFNTTTSMGRLTLNMLLSFAQFEREVTGERIRDKIAASKRKGLWMGGPVPLGYEVMDRKLMAKPTEAEQVRHIMRRYLVVGSVPALVQELEREGYRTKVQRRTSGPHKGGCLYRRGTIYHLLSNRIYRGMTVHKGTAHAGEHEPIVDEDLFEQVQRKLADNASGSSRRRKHRQPSLLTGKLFDGEGRAMTPSHATRPNKRYRYYVTRHDEVDGSPAWRVPAHDLEQLVCRALADRLMERGFILDLQGEEELDAAALQQVFARADLAAATLRSGSDDSRAELLSVLVQRIDLAEGSASITLLVAGLSETLGTAAALQPEAPALIITVPSVRVRRGQQMRLVVPGPEANDQPPPARRDDRLIALMGEALQARELVLANPARSLSSIAAEHGRCRTRLGKLVGLACLAPDIIAAIVEGRQPEMLTARRLDATALPVEWAQQRRVLGFG
jgi:DNA invertase Pin-like site-specific DNA recombinase